MGGNREMIVTTADAMVKVCPIISGQDTTVGGGYIPILNIAKLRSVCCGNGKIKSPVGCTINQPQLAFVALQKGVFK